MEKKTYYFRLQDAHLAESQAQFTNFAEYRVKLTDDEALAFQEMLNRYDTTETMAYAEAKGAKMVTPIKNKLVYGR